MHEEIRPDKYPLDHAFAFVSGLLSDPLSVPL